MARPTKTGIDYFPLDIQVEDKVKLLEAKYGIEGFGIWIKLLQKIYQHNYYIKWSYEKELLFKNEINVDINLLKNIIKDCLEWDILNKKLYDKYAILTSRGIQKRYFEITKRRNEVEVHEEYLLINGDNVNDNFVYVDINSKNVDKSTQSKVKESKVKKRKEKKSKEKKDSMSVRDFFDKYNEIAKEKDFTKARVLNSTRRKKIKTRLKTFDKEVLEKMFDNLKDQEYLKDESWFNLDFLIKNDQNIEKVFNKWLDFKYEEKDKSPYNYDEEDYEI